MFTAPQLCSEDDGEYRCDGGECIQLWQRCDGSSDCSNEKDEQNCCKFNPFY